jgi:hypothetical protein
VTVTVGVGEAVTDFEDVREFEGVTDLVTVGVVVEVTLGDEEAVCEEDAEDVGVCVGVGLGVIVGVLDDVGDAVGVLVGVTVRVGVLDLVGVSLGVAEDDDVVVGVEVGVGVWLGDEDGEDVAVGLEEAEGNTTKLDGGVFKYATDNPCPTSPCSLLPQHFTRPLAVRTQVIGRCNSWETVYQH